MRKRTTKLKDNSAPVELTFMQHMREFQGRLFSVVFFFIIITVAAFPLFDKIVNLLIAPLGDSQELVYLTPSGAFGFMMQVCIYVGIIGSLPFIIYHIYRFVAPAIQGIRVSRAIIYVLWSFILAASGIAFAYIVSLPAALYFLTGFDLHHINPMLTIDSYFSFVMTYLLAGALLFQLPLVIMIINSIKPLKPSQMMNHQGKVLVISFVVAAIISPTPDAVNQALLASPVVVMYQVGIVLVMLANRKKKTKKAHITPAKVSPLEPVSLYQGQVATSSATKPAVNKRPVVADLPKKEISLRPAPQTGIQRSLDGMIGGAWSQSRSNRVVVPQRNVQSYSAMQPRRSIDGFIS